MRGEADLCAESQLQGAEPVGVVRREQGLGTGSRLGPHHGVVVAQGQQGQRAIRREALECTVVMRGGDLRAAEQGVLLVVMHQGAALGAHAAFAAQDQRRLDAIAGASVAVLGLQADGLLAGLAQRDQGFVFNRDGGVGHLRLQLLDQLHRGEDVTQRGDAFLAGTHHGATEAAELRDVDGGDRGGGRGRPGGQAVEDLAAAFRKRQDPRFTAGRIGRAGIEEPHGQPLAMQHQCGGQPERAGPDDGDLSHAPAPRP